MLSLVEKKSAAATSTPATVDLSWMTSENRILYLDLHSTNRNSEVPYLYCTQWLLNSPNFICFNVQPDMDWSWNREAHDKGKVNSWYVGSVDTFALPRCVLVSPIFILVWRTWKVRHAATRIADWSFWNPCNGSHKEKTQFSKKNNLISVFYK
jgi:hypothetical protein